jgi:hypothetical protein
VSTAGKWALRITCHEEGISAATLAEGAYSFPCDNANVAAARLEGIS